MPNTHVPAAGEAMPAAHLAFALPPETAMADRAEAFAISGTRPAAHIETAPAATLAGTTRRAFLRMTPIALLAGQGQSAAQAAAAGEPQTVPAPIKAWSDFVASFADVIPGGARLQIFGSSNSCRVVVLQTFMEPVRPGRSDRMIPVEWIVASYRLTPEGFESECLYPSFREGGYSVEARAEGSTTAIVGMAP